MRKIFVSQSVACFMLDDQDQISQVHRCKEMDAPELNAELDVSESKSCLAESEVEH